MATPDRQGPKRRQRAHQSATPARPAGRPKRETRKLERVRDAARRPKKYFVARRLQESERALGRSAEEPGGERKAGDPIHAEPCPTVRQDRAPAKEQVTMGPKNGYQCPHSCDTAKYSLTSYIW